MIQLFKAVLVTSCAGGLLTALLMVLKPVTQKYFSSTWNYYIWLVVLLVLLVPVRLNVPKQTPVPEFIPTGPGAQAYIQEGEAQRPGRGQPLKRVGKYMDIACLVWLGGAGISLSIKLAAYGLLLRRIRKTSRRIPCPGLTAYTAKKITVRTGDGFRSPFMTGVFHPCLFLPDMELEQEQLDHILRHEMVHLRRRDIWYKWLSVLVKCVHWFNPAAYIAAGQINIACEISCDLAVVADMDKEQELCYINTILAVMSGSRNKTLTTGMAESKKQLKRRFMMIKNRTEKRKITTVVSCVAAAALLSSSVFTSGVLANTIKGGTGVTRWGEQVSFVHQPYTEQGILYLPLRETLNQFVDASHGISEISFDNGEIEVYLFDKNTARTREDGDIVYARLYYYQLKMGEPSMFEHGEPTYAFDAAPVLKDGTAYVPVQMLEMMQAESGLLEGFAAGQ